MIQVMIRFLAISGKLPTTFVPFSLSEDITVDAFLQTVNSAGASGSFCAASDWPGLPSSVLVAANGHMLQHQELVLNGMSISIIGQIIGG